jgi:Zn-dependent protease
MRLCTLFGIEVRLDSSLIIIFALIVYLLGGSVFPGWHPEWPASTRWLTAGAAGVLFFASVLAHEMAHSLMSRRFDIEVERITLFLFGGLAEIQEEPKEPRAELLIAIVGPLTSLVIGLLCTFAGASLAGGNLTELFPEGGEATLAGLSPLATLLLWLGPVNIVLGVFNMIPGFPLDGGRVMRAILWWLTGDLAKATRIASDTGKLFGWFLMALGLMQAVSGMVMQGLWLVLIGWFLSNAASASYRQMVVHDMFKGLTARDLMRSHFETVTAQMRVGEFIDNYFLQSSQLLWPVVEDCKLIGLVTLEQVRGVPPEDRDVVTLGSVMRTDLAALTLAPDTDANRTLLELVTHNTPLAIVENRRVIGLLSQVDAMKWMQLHPRK